MRSTPVLRDPETPPGLWPTCEAPGDLAALEAVALEQRPLPSSTYDALRRTAGAHPDRTALVVLPDGEHWQSPVEMTYGELLPRVTSYANALRASGVGRRDAIGLLSPNVAELVPALLAAEAAGIAVPVNPALDRETVAALLRQAGVRVLVAAGPEVDAGVWERARGLADELDLDALLALNPTRGGTPADGVTYLADLAASAPADHLLGPEPAPHDLAAFFHTGGTTGTPKLAAHTHRMQVVDAWSVATLPALAGDATVLAALPLFHVNALVVTTLAPLLRGCRAVWAGPLGYRDAALMRDLWKVVEHYGVTAMSAVPTVYDALSRLPLDADISSLQMPIVGAAPLPPAVREAWRLHTGVPLCEGYGLTEATCATSRSFPQHPRTGSVGQRLPYQRVAAVEVDPSTGEWTFLPPGRTGTLVISGPTVFPGYVVGRDAGGPVLDHGGKVRDGWLDTGDLGSVDENGFVALSGRAKDVIIRGGHNIDPAEVEEVLRRHPAVVDAGVVGRPDPHAGEVPVAFVVVDDPSVDGDALREWAAREVPERAAAPKSVTVLPKLPQTAVGKPFKPALRVLAAEQELGPALAAIGHEVPPTGWCAYAEGRVVVVLPAPPDEARRAAVSDLMNRYPVPWSFR